MIKTRVREEKYISVKFSSFVVSSCSSVEILFRQSERFDRISHDNNSVFKEYTNQQLSSSFVYKYKKSISAVVVYKQICLLSCGLMFITSPIGEILAYQIGIQQFCVH
jgi:hypothetical protein